MPTSNKGLLRYVALATLIIAVIGCAGASAAASIPLCGSAHGFAGEQNYKFTLIPNVEVDKAAGEAVVLAVRPVPYNPNMPTAFAEAIIDASYDIGNETFRLTSASDGLLTMTESLPAGTAINIAVRNTRLDGLTPFVLYTYVANSPYCFLSVNPRRGFLGPVPGSAVGRPASIYFSAVPPSNMGSQGRAAFRFSVVNGVPCTLWYAVSGADMQNQRMLQLQMDREVMWTRNTPVYIEVRPMFAGSRAVMLRAVVEWRIVDGPDDMSGSVAMPNTNTGGNSYNGGYGSTANTNNNANNNAKWDEEEDSGDIPDTKNVPAPQGSRVGSKIASISLIGYLVLAFVAYLIIGAIYNFRVRDVRTFPECVPHHQTFATVFGVFSSTASGFRSRAARARGGYSGINGAEDEV